MPSITKEKLLETLGYVTAPKSGKDIVNSGLVSNISIDEDKVIFSIIIDPNRSAEMEDVRKKGIFDNQLHRAIDLLKGIKAYGIMKKIKGSSIIFKK